MSDAFVSSNTEWYDDDSGPSSALFGLMEEHQSAPWRKRALCRGMDPSIFVPWTDEERQLARATCAECPVSEECLQSALDAERDPGGIYGGTDQFQRRRMKKRKAHVDGFKNHGTPTHCVNGHLRTPDNVSFHEGRERCKTCKVEATRRDRERKKAELAAERAATRAAERAAREAELAAARLKRTTCANGHPWVGEMVFIDHKGKLDCLQCKRDRNRAHMRRKRAEAS